MKKLQFLYMYLKVFPFYYWATFWLMPRLYKSYPHDSTVAVYEVEVIRFTEISSVVAHSQRMRKTKNEAYLRMRLAALQIDFRTPAMFGISFRLRKVGE
ncbi:hypothetical protein SHAb15599_00130 [Acinetobacter phage SH-Ab 15599]|nr:hypothetical protein SHAb15599_00130 [Acinetobacter phage SH-Ab 15599]